MIARSGASTISASMFPVYENGSRNSGSTRVKKQINSQHIKEYILKISRFFNFAFILVEEVLV